MTGIIILAVIAVLILLIFFLPYGVDVIYRDEILRLGVKAGPIRIWLLPKKPKSAKKLAREAERKKKKEAKKLAKKSKSDSSKKKKEIDETQKVKPKKKLDIQFLLALLKMGAHAIRRFFRSFTINFFQLHLTVGSDDPYKTATEYSYLCAAVEALPELTGRVIRVGKKDIRVGADFTADSPAIAGRITLSLQLFKIVHVAFAFAAEFLKWKITHPGEDPAEAMERKDDNGRE